jgi:hypothetical protein
MATAATPRAAVHSLTLGSRWMVSFQNSGLAPGPVGPQCLDDGDLAGRWNDAGPLQIVAADAGAGGLAADIEHHGIAHHQPIEWKLVHRAAVARKCRGASIWVPIWVFKVSTVSM